MTSRSFWLVVLLSMLMALVLTACGGGGGDDTTTPPIPDPGNNGQTGDPDEQTPIGIPEGQFTLPGGAAFGDLRGVAASQEYVYIADSSTLYAFDKNGNYVNAATAPATIQAVAVFPPKPDMDNLPDYDYFVAGFPVVMHDPVGGYGYVTIWGPNLDTMTTREDEGHPDAPKFISLPGPQMDPPNQDSQFLCMAVYDGTVDRFGSILVTIDMDVKLTQPAPDYTRGLQIFNVFTGWTIIEGGSTVIQDEDGNDITIGVPIFEESTGSPTGEMGTLAVDTFFPFNRTETTYTYYTGAFNLLRDFVGVAQITLNLNTIPAGYTISPSVANGFGYTRVIGESVGNAPGSFNQNPPRDPDGGLEDPDLTAGGPSGMNVDWLSDEVYICDPGNRRIQVFAPQTGAFVRTIGDGTRGSAGTAFLAPSSVTIDMEGNVFICDVNNLRVIRESFPDRLFGNVGGQVRRIDTLTPLEGATVTLGNELGTLAVRTSNINGEYIIRNVLVGTYYMSATKFRYDSDTAVISIIKDHTVRADFNLIPQEPATTGSYTGTIIDANSNLWLPDVTVHIIGTSITSTTDDIGRFIVNNIPPGTYQVVFTLDGYETLTRDVEILSGTTTTDLLLQMQPE